MTSRAAWRLNRMVVNNRCVLFFDVYLFSKNEGTEKIRPYTPITGQWDWYIHIFFSLHTFNII